MNPSSKRQRLVEALEVDWTPALAARTQRRIRETLARRGRQRRALVVSLALLVLGGVSFAFPGVRERLLRRPRQVAPAVAPKSAHSDVVVPPRQTAVAPPAPPPAAPPTPGTTAATRVHRRRLASATSATSSPVETVASLFAAADAARLAGRPAEAVVSLTAIVDRFPHDRRAALAAFELGRVLADDLHDAVAAARAFGRAHDLDPGGPLAAAAAARAKEAQRASGTGAP